MPPGLFEMLSVRAHREKHNLKFLNHWGGGFHARHKEENVQVLKIFEEIHVMFKMENSNNVI